ncbi:MAG TPA: ectonucleotide pyrophosphatase/phosphodiesterase [Chitinophagaceae bacterium]|nr:ectonucleotide pyrophosphatase/phosphodiesterase [Chitinophagaceae bacterium]
MCKAIKYLFALFCIISAMPVLAQRVIVIGFDGFSSEAYKTISHPNIDRLFQDGVVSVTTRPVMPSVTLPNWTSHFTGSGPEEHGVTANSWTLENRPLKAVETDEDGYYPSIFKVLKEQVPGVKTAFYYNWAELINSFNKKYLDEVSFEYKDRYDSNYNKAVDFLKRNSRSPSLVFLYSVHTDHAGHDFGWMSPQYVSSIQNADSAVGRLVENLKSENLYKGSYFLLITDHGGINKGHGGTSMSEMQVPWAITGPKVRKIGLSDFYNSNKNTSFMLADIFKIKSIPKSWTRVAPAGILK